MEVDRWILERTEQVLTCILETVDLPEGLLIPVMTEAARANPGILYLAGAVCFFEEVEIDQSPEDEAKGVILAYSLHQGSSHKEFDSAASAIICDWCSFFFEICGSIMMVADQEAANALGWVDTAFRESDSDGEER